jgi:hypothetical protein
MNHAVGELGLACEKAMDSSRRVAQHLCLAQRDRLRILRGLGRVLTKITIGDSDPFNVCFGPLRGLKSDITQGREVPIATLGSAAPAPEACRARPSLCQTKLHFT